MLADVTVVRKYFSKLGLEDEIADLYLALYTHGPQSISDLSRNSGVERTRIYRLIDTLLGSNLIEVETHYKRGTIKAAPIANLHILISQKEQEVKALQDGLGLIEKVLSRNSLSSPATRVQFYQGPEGAKQMFWNQTAAKTEMLCILYQPIQVSTGKTFFERWVSKFNEEHISARGIGGDHFYDALKKWRDKHDTKQIDLWQGRYVDSETYPIDHNTVIYNDVTSYFNWQNNEIFGIEIYNQQIADSQRKLFQLLWDISNPQTPLDT